MLSDIIFAEVFICVIVPIVAMIANKFVVWPSQRTEPPAKRMLLGAAPRYDSNEKADVVLFVADNVALFLDYIR